MNTPMRTTFFQPIPGGRTRNTAGMATRMNRIVVNSSGGMAARPASMTTKLEPQMIATRMARTVSLGFTLATMTFRTQNHQQTF